jgi:hypothetical protein
MIDNINLCFTPKNTEDYKLYESILSNFQYKRNMIIESLDENIKLYIFTDKKFIIFKIFHMNEYMGLNEITNKDYFQFQNQFNNAVKFLGINLDMLKLTRIDYKLDLKLSEEEMQEYLYIFSKLRQHYYSLEKKVYWNSDKTKLETVYYKGARFNLNLYDKHAQLLKKGINDPIYDDVLRLELQVKSRELTEYCKAFGISKELLNFWHTSVREDFFNSLLIEKFLYSGDYFNLKNVKKQTKDIKQCTQQKIIEFCKSVVEADITEAINTLSRGTATKYIKELTVRKINPVTIKNFDYLLGIKTILEEKSKAK